MYLHVRFFAKICKKMYLLSTGFVSKYFSPGIAGNTLQNLGGPGLTVIEDWLYWHFSIFTELIFKKASD